MKTIDVVKTIRWIDSQIGETAKKAFFAREMLRGSAKVSLATVLRVSNELAIAQQAISNHPFALKVLASFGISALFDSQTTETILAEIGSHGGERPPDATLWNLLRKWDVMIGCVSPIEGLTVPTEVANETDFDELLTIQILRSEDASATVNTLQSVIEGVEELYQCFTTLKKDVSMEPLHIVYISSGSSIRLDLKGLSEPIKQIKNLLVEGWSLWRHRKATELSENSRALLASLKTLTEIDKQVEAGAMKKSDGEALKGRMQKAMMGLFHEGALPREVPTVETLSNAKLIELNPQKLLAAPVETEPSLTTAVTTEEPISAEEIASFDTNVNAHAQKAGKRPKTKKVRRRNRTQR